MIYNLIYKTTHTDSGKIYIGAHSTDNLDDGYLGSGTNLKRDIIIYGKDAFSFRILEHHDNADDMFLSEKNIVNKEFRDRADTYNLKTGGYGGRASEESRKKMSAASKGRPKSKEHRASLSLAKQGKTRCLHTIATKARMSAASKGRPKSKEHRASMSVAATGRKASDTTKAKMSASRKGKQQRVVECPFCHTKGGKLTMHRWHFNNCKRKRQWNQITLN